jgi:hypothetical protein
VDSGGGANREVRAELRARHAMCTRWVGLDPAYLVRLAEAAAPGTANPRGAIGRRCPGSFWVWSDGLCPATIGGVNSDADAYVARYGWNGRSIALIAGALVFVVIAVTAPMSLPLRIVTIVLFGGGAVWFTGTSLSRRVALRVDASGVMLGGSPARYGSTTLLVHWADVKEIVLWRQPMPYGRSVRYLGIVRRKHARQPARRRRRRASQAAARALTPDISADTLMASRAVNLWRLDPGRMAAAVARFAPAVQVIDQDTGQVIEPAR